ncbi:MAG: M23 family metallopeptidase [Clostridiaceae bacterium]|nr:M23 family metallopeptidase [Clostridiaceae bacterium]
MHEKNLNNTNSLFKKFNVKSYINNDKSSANNINDINIINTSNITNITNSNSNSNGNIECVSENVNESINHRLNNNCINSINNNIYNTNDISIDNPTGIEIDDTEFRKNKGKVFTKVYFTINKNSKVSLKKYKRKNTNRIPAKFSLANPFNRIKQLNVSNNVIKQKKHRKGDTLSKSNAKSRSRYISISFVPHSPEKIKTLRVSNLYIKFAVIWILFLTVSTYSLSTFINTWNENRLLKASIDAITSKNAEQISLLSEKYGKISELLDESEKANINITELSAKYREIIEKYVDGRINGSIASRSGNRTDSTFIKDVKDLNNILNELSEVNASREDLMVDLSDIEENLRNYLDSLPTQWPVNARISSDFGTRRDPITGRRSFHKGIDLAANYGVSIKPAGSGIVTYVGSYNELGLTVIIDHGNGIKSVYSHTSKALVKKGQAVTRDTIIAKVGSSGRSTGAHLHFEIRINDTPVDPLKYLESK